jgi:ABC-2 type transport system permease protein
MPAAIRVITYVLPARYYVTLLQTIFLAGNVWRVILPNMLVLAVMTVLLGFGARAATRKRLD